MADSTWASTAVSTSTPPKSSMLAGSPTRSNPVALRRTRVTSKLDPPKSTTATVVPSASSTSWLSLAIAAIGSGTSTTGVALTWAAAASSTGSTVPARRSG